MKDIRCDHCNKLLCRQTNNYTLKVKYGKMQLSTIPNGTAIVCPGCGTVNDIPNKIAEKL